MRSQVSRHPLGLGAMGINIQDGLDATTHLPTLPPEVRRTKVSGGNSFPRECVLVCHRQRDEERNGDLVNIIIREQYPKIEGRREEAKATQT